jgi:phytoene/squalene synthetase
MAELARSCLPLREKRRYQLILLPCRETDEVENEEGRETVAQMLSLWESRVDSKMMESKALQRGNKDERRWHETRVQTISNRVTVIKRKGIHAEMETCWDSKLSVVFTPEQR